MFMVFCFCSLQSLKDLAYSMIGQSVYVNWPHLNEAQVVAVSDGETR